MPVAVGAAVLGPLVAAGADLLGGFGPDQRLRSGADQLGEHRPHLSGLQGIELGEQGRMVMGHRVVCPLLESLWQRHTRHAGTRSTSGPKPHHPRGLTLPMSPTLTAAQVDRVCDVIIATTG